MLMLSWFLVNLSLRTENSIFPRKTQLFESTVWFPCYWRVVWPHPLMRATPCTERWLARSSSVPSYMLKSTVMIHSKLPTETTSFNLDFFPMQFNTSIHSNRELEAFLGLLLTAWKCVIIELNSCLSSSNALPYSVGFLYVYNSLNVCTVLVSRSLICFISFFFHWSKDKVRIKMCH